MMSIRRVTRLALLLVVIGGTAILAAQQAPPPALVTTQEISEGLPRDGSRWITFGGSYTNQRHSPLTQITPANVKGLVPQWTFQTGTLGNFETTPLLRDNILYVTGPQNVAWALDARTGRQIWRYRRELPTDLTACCGLVNRGFAMLGDKLFMVTLDAHLLALDMRTGAIVWDATLEQYKNGYAATIAPIVVKDKVIVGAAGGEFGIRGFIDAYDAQTGKRAWRFYTIPGPGEPGNDTWAGDSWKTGGASVWVTGAYDPELNLLYYGIGNPGPDYHSESRLGDNLYAASHRRARRRHRKASLALPVHAARRARLGRDRGADPRRPHHRRSAAQGRDVRQSQRLLLHARSHQRPHHPRQALRADDMGERDRARRPARARSPDTRPTRTARSRVPTSPAAPTSGRRPSIPSTRTFFVNAREACMTFYAWKPDYKPGERFTGGAGQRYTSATMPVYGALRAIDPTTGERKWEFKYLRPSTSGLLDHGLGPDLQRRQRRQRPRARLAQRYAPVALPDGRQPARHVSRSPTWSMAGSTCSSPRARH